jgi:hypothetical protein
MFNPGRLAQILKREQKQKTVVRAYSKKHRFIRPDIYRELKK